MHIFNQALLARQAWRLLEFPESLCAQVLKARYYPDGDLMDTVFVGNASSTWQAIAYGLELLKEGIIWRVGRGTSIRVWRDNWIPRETHLKPVSLQGRCRSRWVADFLDDNGRWKLDELQRWFLLVDVDAISKIRPAVRNDGDFYAWHPEKTGIFTKVRIFAWKVATDCLATRVNKEKRSLEKHGNCTICGTGEENSYHTLCECPHARVLWIAMLECWDIPDAFHGDARSEWLFILLENATPVQRSLLLLLLWRIWHVHNEFTHDKSPPPVPASKSLLQSYAESLLAIKQFPNADPAKGKEIVCFSSLKPVKRRRHSDEEELAWQKSVEGWTKLNVDGSFVAETGEACTGMVLHDHLGAPVFSAVRYLQACQDALEAELATCMEGLALALERTTPPIVVENDSSELVSLVSARSHDRSRYFSFVEKLKCLLAMPREIKIIKVHRS
ncbi:hypothetical protein BRADI_4g01061v3 [Brachypodium distachyon]|uniref:RNase H type-1 domain-containing protein n=1 Tax=Brachypodium distachyon TaxID=15368 RepID=A0A2K2CJS4_BRADI|nr:hypothetical protein BRADI_4g01061v3 [Brachypodium distachyon]